MTESSAARLGSLPECPFAGGRLHLGWVPVPVDLYPETVQWASTFEEELVASLASMRASRALMRRRFGELKTWIQSLN